MCIVNIDLHGQIVLSILVLHTTETQLFNCMYIHAAIFSDLEHQNLQSQYIILKITLLNHAISSTLKPAYQQLTDFIFRDFLFVILVSVTLLCNDLFNFTKF